MILKNVKQTAEKFKQFFENCKNLLLLKHIFALPTMGLRFTISELQPLTFDSFSIRSPCSGGSSFPKEDRIFSEHKFKKF